jgi:hypothetical protein
MARHTRQEGTSARRRKDLRRHHAGIVAAGNEIGLLQRGTAAQGM